MEIKNLDFFKTPESFSVPVFLKKRKRDTLV